MPATQSNSRRIGYFGGTFDPPHMGHRKIISSIIRQYEIDQLWVIPTSINPLKSNRPILSTQSRWDMCKLTFSDMPNLMLSDIEIWNTGNSYTIDALRKIKNYTNQKIKLFIGSDVFFYIDKWKNIQDIIYLADIVVIQRKGESDWSDVDKARIGKYNAELIDLKIPEISSSDIRTKLKGESTKGKIYFKARKLWIESTNGLN